MSSVMAARWVDRYRQLANATDLLTLVLWTMAGGWVRTTVLFFAVCGRQFIRLRQQTQERSQFATPFLDCRYLVPFRRHSRSKSEVVWNRAKQACFRPQFLGGGPQILDLIFKIAPISDHVAKFRGDRPRDRGDLVLNKKKERKKQQQNIRARARCVIATGGPNNKIWLVHYSQ